MVTADEVAAIDIGNSRVKAAIFQADRIVATLAISTSLPETEIRSLLKFFRDWQVQAILISSVVPDSTARLTEALQAEAIPIAVCLHSDGRIFQSGVLGHQLETPETTGIDRVLATISAMDRANGKPVIVVTAGSAITVNLAKGGLFLGGAILPGLELMLRSLHQGTASLPLVQVEPSFPEPLGKSTHSAIRAGVFYSAAAAVDRLVDEFENAAAENCQVYLTGGDAERLRTGLRPPRVYHYVEHLVLEGLHRVYRATGGFE